MSIFGWNYPPGAAGDPAAPYNQPDPPCELCGKHTDACQCPACAICGAIGLPLHDALCSGCLAKTQTGTPAQGAGGVANG